MVNPTARPPAQRVQAEPLPEGELGAPEDLLSKGKTLQKIGTPFVTAMGVQKKRDLGRVIAAMENEAKYAGDSFYYSLPFGDNVEGPSIGLAVSLAREWGNCAVTMDVQETDDAFLFTARFIDLETGYQLDRAFRQRKAGAVHGKFDGDRKLDMAFQIGQSKAIRNVILNATPRWLQDRMVTLAKAAVAAEITPEMLLAERQKIADTFASTFRVTLEMLTAKIGRGMPDWTANDVATLRGNFKALQTKDITVEELFGGDRKTQAATPGPVKLADLPPIGGAPPAAETVDEGGAPSAAEQAAIKRKEIWEAKGLKCSKCPPYTFATDAKAEMDEHMHDEHGGPAPAAKPTTTPPKKGNAPPGGIFG